MGKMQVRQEARALQGKSIRCADRTLTISGGSSQAEFEMGSEGLVHLATDESTGEKVRVKCFWEPDERRRRRSETLVELKLPDLNKSNADALGGAPFGMLPSLGPHTPFAVVMKNVCGESWKKLRARAETESRYPPSWWPSREVLATWGYGLATAVMKMETRGFIHADLSPGNVVVNDGVHGIRDAGNLKDDFVPDEAGDMALVDFDRYVHVPGNLPDPGQGSPGYAAPEIWQKQTPSLGSDRTALAILIQEFFVSGDPDISREEALNWSYSQEERRFEWSFAEASEHSSVLGDVHFLFDRKYPSLAQLVRDTLAASGPAERPTPEDWRRPLLEIASSTPSVGRAQFRGLLIESDPIKSSELMISFSPSRDSLDLSSTPFGIRAYLERDLSGAIFLVVHDGAAINIKWPESKKWTQYTGGTRVIPEIGMILFDKEGRSTARFNPPK